METIREFPPAEARMAIRTGEWEGPTAGLAMGYAQANLVILPKRYAFDFLLFCQRNPKPCPLLEVVEAGEFRPEFLAPGADLRTDLPRYRVYRDGRLADSPREIGRYWEEDFVTFLLGCSFSFEEAMLRAGIPLHHIEEGKNVSMYTTTVPCRPAGVFSGPLVVSMRPIPMSLVPRAVQITSRYASVHGAPVHIGDPAAIGIPDLRRPDFGDPVTIREGEVPVFWACGVTPQAVVMEAKPALCITHEPGHMFITDRLNEELSTL
jgi:uncharacterized protein YcsI (UPF0317 family)